jgi:hypothetical protein
MDSILVTSDPDEAVRFVLDAAPRASPTKADIKLHNA